LGSSEQFRANLRGEKLKVNSYYASYRQIGSVFAIVLGSAASLAPLPVFAQASAVGSTDGYPSKPVRVILGPAPGGATDLIARMIAQKLSENLRRSFIVENRTGAGGTVADALVAKSAPDGYTLLAVAGAFTITPAIYPRLSYDPIKDFTPISLAAQAPFVLMTHPTLPVKSAKDLIALARAKPGALDAASGGIGSSPHMALELFTALAKVKITHVPYKGTGPALIDLMAGQVHMMFGNVLSSLPHIKNGRMRALAVTSAKRSVVMPDLPTIAESGVPGYETTTWHGWLGPAGMPPQIVRLLNAEMIKAVRAPELTERLATDGAEPVGSTPEQFSRYIATEITRWSKIIKESGVKLNE